VGVFFSEHGVDYFQLELRRANLLATAKTDCQCQALGLPIQPAAITSQLKPATVAQRYRTLVFDRRAFADALNLQLTGDHLCE